jgi:hypothetical protein
MPQLAQFHALACYVVWEGLPLIREDSGRGGSVRCGYTISP